jgi:transposase InsO family protein
VEHARQCGASERHACHLVHQPRGTQRYQPTQRNDEDALTRAIITLADRYGRYGYRRITIKLREAGWNVGKDRVERIWRREGLKVPQKQKPRGRLWLNDGSCVRLRPEHQNHVWSYDFVSTFTHVNSKLRDEFLNGEIFYSLKEVQVLAERWRIYYNTERPHSSLGYRPPAPVAWQIKVPLGHGKVESKQRFPLLHAHDCGGELTNSPSALH